MDAADELVRLRLRDLKRELGSQAATLVEWDAIGFTRDQIAELLGTTHETVRNAIKRGRTPKNGVES